MTKKQPLNNDGSGLPSLWVNFFIILRHELTYNPHFFNAASCFVLWGIWQNSRRSPVKRKWQRSPLRINCLLILICTNTTIAESKGIWISETRVSCAGCFPDFRNSPAVGEENYHIFFYSAISATGCMTEQVDAHNEVTLITLFCSSDTFLFFFLLFPSSEVGPCVDILHVFGNAFKIWHKHKHSYCGKGRPQTPTTIISHQHFTSYPFSISQLTYHTTQSLIAFISDSYYSCNQIAAKF